MEYLRTMPTLRPRTNTFNAAFRVRSAAAYAIHKFFQENGFVYSHSLLLPLPTVRAQARCSA